MEDLEKKPSVMTAAEVSTGQTTKRGLKSRHAQMLALGGTIGTAIFVSSGQTFARGGPAFILGCFCFISIAVYTVLAGLTEVATWLPVPGSSVSLYASRFVSPSFGFATGWLYVYSMSILAPYEITAASLVISYWHSSMNIAFYGETEFWFAFMKVVMMTGLLIVSVVIFFGGGPNHDRLGFRYWNNPGAANEYLVPGNTGRFLALISTLTLAALPFTFAPEFLILITGEMVAPRKTLPKASRRYIYRILFFYILSVLAIGVICPSTDSRLTSGGQGAGASPFVVGIKNAVIPVLDSIINAGILLSAWSSGNAFLYMATRSLYSLARAGDASSWFLACTASGVPYRCVAVCSLFYALAYLNLSNSAAVVFNWFVNFTNQSAFISWTCCCIVHIRFRKACDAQGVTNLPYVSRFQPWGSYAGLALFPFLALVNGFDVFFPSKWSVESFLTAYIGIPLFLAIYFGHRVYTWYEPWVRDSNSVDLHSGLEEVLEEEEPVVSDNKWWSVVNRLWE